VKTIKRLLAVVAIGACAALGSGVTAAATPTGPAGLPPFTASVHTVTAERLGLSWHEGCPVGPDQLRLVKMSVLGFDGRVYRGELVVAADVVVDVVGTFAELYYHRYPIERMLTVEKYDADDDRSMAADNTSAFNCRAITGGTAWSNHSYGRAIDVNPVRNPYISASGTVYPPNGAPYVDRTRADAGLIHADDSTVQAFERRGWDWGGYWDTPIDYQHFEKPAA
jgi:hypothetical protein